MAASNNRKTIVVFAEAPVPGEVKTRLTPFLSEASAADLHRRLVVHTLQTITQLTDCFIELWVGSEHDWWTELAERFAVPVYRQRGNDLGERMSYALDKALQGSKQVLIVGTDCPDITPQYLQRALDSVEQQGVVIGPADDGGYVLLGLSQPMPWLFNDMRWGADSIFATTVARMEEKGVSWFELQPLMDIDRPEDFIRLQQLRPNLTEGLSVNGT